MIRSSQRCQRASKTVSSATCHYPQLSTFMLKQPSYWDPLPNLDHDGPFFCCNVHIEIYYTTTLIYMGCPFIITQVSSGSHNPDLGSSIVHEVPDTVQTFARTHYILHAALRDMADILSDTEGICETAAHSTIRIVSTMTSHLNLVYHQVNAMPCWCFLKVPITDWR